MILDSIDNVKSSRSFADRWAEEERTAQEFVSMSSEFDCPCFTCFQANRPGYGRELIDQHHVKGSLDKCRLMAHILTINQDSNEALTDESGFSIARLFVAKNRFGPRGFISQVQVNFARCEFESFDEQS